MHLELAEEILDVAEAIDDPLGRVDLWCSWAPREVAARLNQVMHAISSHDDPVNTKTARLVLGWPSEVCKVSQIAKEHRLSAPAVSQRKSRIERDLQSLFDDSDLARHPIVVLWRDRASRCVREDDLPDWMRSFLRQGTVERPWGIGEDVLWVLLHVIMREPRLLVDEAGSRWLVDGSLDARGESNSFKSLIDSVADVVAAGATVVLTTQDLQEALVAAGVSARSLEPFGAAMSRVANRRILYQGRAIILGPQVRNLRGIISELIDVLGIDQNSVVDLISSQLEFASGSVRNELRRMF